MIKHAAKLVLTLIVGLTLGGAASAQAPCPGCDTLLLEVYSNADGSVQFLVMLDTSIIGRPDAPSSLAGQTIVASNGSTENSFTLPSDLNLAAGRLILVATQGFADLHLVNPDFIVPNGFLFTYNGSITLRPHNWYALTLQYAALPTDGVKALYPDADRESVEYTEIAQATNNAGQTHVFSAEKFTGLWWNAPAGSESGWGIAVDHQGEIVFTIWATYDTDGSPTWFVMLARHAVAGSDDPFYYFGTPNMYLGEIYRMTGPAFGGVTFDTSAVIATKVGTGGIRFSTTFNNGDNSAFWFTSSERYISKTITRDIFASPVPVCVEGAVARPAPNFEGMWRNASESGWGLHLTHQGDIVFAIWFTYDTTGKATWLMMPASRTAENAYAGAIYRTTGPAYDASTFDPSKVTASQVGSGTLTFADRSNGTFSYTVNSISQTKNIAREIFADPPTVCNE